MQAWNIVADKYSVEYIVFLLCQNLMVEKAESIAAMSLSSEGFTDNDDNITMYICLARASAILLNTNIAQKYACCAHEEIERIGRISSRTAIPTQQTGISFRVFLF